VAGDGRCGGRARVQPGNRGVAVKGIHPLHQPGGSERELSNVLPPDHHAVQRNQMENTKQMSHKKKEKTHRKQIVHAKYSGVDIDSDISIGADVPRA
jgi:hypothetical protein